MSSSGVPSRAREQVVFLVWLAAAYCAVTNAQAPPPADLHEAARLDGEGKCAESEPLYRRALSSGSPSPALLNNAGNHYLACGNPAKAREYFALLISRVPSHPNANLQMARMAVEGNRKLEAEKFLRALAGQRDPGILAEVGALYARLGDFKLAQQVFQRITALHPGDFDALWNLGRAAARAGDLPRAREALEAALRLQPEDAGALAELGSALAAGGDFPGAVFLLAQAQAKSPRNPGIALNLARAAEDAGYYGDAAIAYDGYLQLRPGDSSAQRDRARVVANIEGRRDEGLKALKEYVEAHPLDPAGHFQLAQLCWNTDAEKSLAHLAEAVRLDPKLAAAHAAKAWLLHRLGRDAEALKHLRAALQLQPADVRALDQHGLVLLALERPKEAEAAFRKAAALAPADWEVRLHLGRVLMEQGRESEARVWLDQYQKLRPARQRDPRREPGMIELATLPAADRRAREIERFRTMARSRPDDGLLRAHLGSLLLADGRTEEAAREFQALLASNADDPTLAQAGRALVEAGRYEWALPFLERAGARLDRALAMFHTRGPGDALTALADVSADEQQSPEFLLLKARILDSMDRPGEAGQLLTGALRRENLRPQVAAQAALLLARYERYGEAAPILARAIAAGPGDRRLLLLEAIVLALDGGVPAADQRLSRIEERWPEWDRPYRVHALVLTAAKRNQEAAQKLQTAGALSATGDETGCRSLRDWLLPSCLGEFGAP